MVYLRDQYLDLNSLYYTLTIYVIVPMFYSLSTRFLDIVIDDKLSWLHHIACICTKLNKSLTVIYKVKNILNVDFLKYLYNALILPYLFYCCEV